MAKGPSKKTWDQLGLNSRKIRGEPSVGNSAPHRIERSKVLLNFVNSSAHSKKIRIFSDEKLFVVDQVINRQNDHYCTNVSVSLVDLSVKFNSVSKHSAKIMVLGVLASDSKKWLLVFTKENEMITAEVYQNFFKTNFLPWQNKIYVSGTFVFQQDGAPAHTSRSIMAFLDSETMEFWMSPMCPPSSPDLNPLD